MLYSEIQIQTLSRFFPPVVKAKCCYCCSFDDALFALIQKTEKKASHWVATPYSWAEIKNRNTREGWLDEWKDVGIRSMWEIWRGWAVCGVEHIWNWFNWKAFISPPLCQKSWNKPNQNHPPIIHASLKLCWSLSSHQYHFITSWDCGYSCTQTSITLLSLAFKQQI